MDSPFQMISDVFQDDYCVNFSVERPDGSVVLTLSDARGVVVKRFISAEQWRNPERLQRFITSVRFGLAIENGQASPELLAAMSPAAASAVAPAK